MKIHRKKLYVFHIISWIVIFNVYLLYQSIASQNGFIKYFQLKKEYIQREEIYKKNNKEIDEKIDLLTLSNINNSQGDDVLDEFVKKNYDYREKNEKIIIIN